MSELDHPTLGLNPQGYILLGDKHELEILEPYDAFRDGPRFVLADAEAHVEWKKRKIDGYKTRDELLSRDELRSYAETGCIPRADITVSSLVPSPPRVVFHGLGYRGKVALQNVIKAHRENKIHLQAVVTAESSDCFYRGARWKHGTCNSGRDDHGVRGCVEEALRLKIKLEDNTTPIMSCLYGAKQQAYNANRKAILECIGNIKCRKVQDTRERWTTKFGWARTYQKTNGGISLDPPNTKASKKRRRAQIEGIRYDRERHGAALATMSDLHIPQIAWGPDPTSREFDVLVIGHETLMQWKDELCVPSRRGKVIVLSKDRAVPDTLAMKSYMSLLGEVRVLTSAVDIQHLHLLIQWIPLWWDYPKHKRPEKVKQMPHLRRRLGEFLRTVQFDSDNIPLWILQLRGETHLPLYATACGWNDCKPPQTSL